MSARIRRFWEGIAMPNPYGRIALPCLLVSIGLLGLLFVAACGGGDGGGEVGATTETVASTPEPAPAPEPAAAPEPTPAVEPEPTVEGREGTAAQAEEQAVMEATAPAATEAPAGEPAAVDEAERERVVVAQLVAPPVAEVESTGAWEFTEHGHYDLAEVHSDASRRGLLRLVCGEGQPWDSPTAILIVKERLPSGRDVRSVRVDYRIEGGITVPSATWHNLTFEGGASTIAASDAAGFVAWLAVNYTRSPILHLTVLAAESPVEPYTVWSRATFDLTGLPAVLADLPCFGVSGG